MMNDKIPADSVYARLLDSIPILPVNLRTKFIDKKFKVNKVEVKGSEADYLKLAKVLMASMYVVGLDPNKTKIPNWMWALVEDDEAWEQFPWGSLSYQFLIGQINAVKKFIPGPYHLKGNTVAFLPWIYEVIPSIGLKFGGRMDQEKRPRMLRYRYSTASDFPEYPSKELISVLEPSDREKRNEDEDEEEVVPVGGGASTLTANAQLLPPNLLVGPDREALIKEIGDYVGKIAAKRARMEVGALLRIHEEKLVGAVGEYVVRRLSEMERTPADVPQATERQAMDQPTASVAEATEGGTNADGITIPTIEKAAGQEMTKFDTMLDPSDTQKNAIYDDLVCLAKVTPPAQGILPGAVPAAGAMQQPTFGKAIGQEMLDPSDTQMNAIYDELVCLGEVTPPVQCIPQGAIGPREALEQPAPDKMIAMNDDITPPAQSILPCAVGSSRHAPIMVAQLKTPTALAIPKVVLNVRPIRRRFPAAAIRSPFLHDDIRGGDTFDHYLRLEDGGMRNVGQPCGVDKTFFEEIETPDKQLHIEHIESYVAILSARPDLAGLKEVHSNIALALSYFMETVEEVFDVLHRGMRQEFQRYDHKLFDPTIEEEIPVEEMDMMCLFAEAVQPNWGENMKQWIECDKVVTICNYNDHWGTVLLDLKRQKIWLYDSMAWKFDYHHICNRRDVFLPMMRVVPQILKRIGYFDRHRVKSPQLAQWELCFPSPKENSFKQMDSANCGLYALKYVEQLISKTKMPKSLKTDRELILYRDHIARSIYAHSTAEPTVPIPMELI
ncbi:hypothetical protein OROHE_003006 [Orobanche hederae]